MSHKRHQDREKSLSVYIIDMTSAAHCLQMTYLDPSTETNFVLQLLNVACTPCVQSSDTAEAFVSVL